MFLRKGLLDGKSVAISGSVAPALRDELVALGAVIAPPGENVDALVHDAGEALTADGLSVALEQAWSSISEVAAGQLIPAGRAGKVVLIAPRPDVGDHASAARDALENLARTLSIEWARYGITAVAIAPASATTDQELATLVSFLLSRAGDYFSGCRLELGSVDDGRP